MISSLQIFVAVISFHLSKKSYRIIPEKKRFLLPKWGLRRSRTEHMCFTFQLRNKPSVIVTFLVAGTKRLTRSSWREKWSFWSQFQPRGGDMAANMWQEWAAGTLHHITEDRKQPVDRKWGHFRKPPYQWPSPPVRFWPLKIPQTLISVSGDQVVNHLTFKPQHMLLQKHEAHSEEKERNSQNNDAGRSLVLKK